jgi:hypothetical protein
VFSVRVKVLWVRPILSRDQLNEKYENRHQRQPVLPATQETHEKKAAMIGCPQLFVSALKGLLWGLHDNPFSRNGEGSTDAWNGIATQIVVGVIA